MLVQCLVLNGCQNSGMMMFYKNIPFHLNFQFSDIFHFSHIEKSPSGKVRKLLENDFQNILVAKFTRQNFYQIQFPRNSRVHGLCQDTRYIIWKSLHCNLPMMVEKQMPHRILNQIWLFDQRNCVQFIQGKSVQTGNASRHFNNATSRN